MVYNEYINDRTHVHMNSTKWLTLTDFVKYLGRIGACVRAIETVGWVSVYHEGFIRDRCTTGGATPQTLDPRP